MRWQKGITLIALILTIVVLLILAVVSITAIQNTEIINHATNSAKQYNQAQKDENQFLSDYNSYLEGLMGSGSGTGTEGDGTGSTTGVITFTITLKNGSTVCDTRTYSAVNGTSLTSWVGTEYNTDEWEYVSQIWDGLRFRMWLTEEKASDYGTPTWGAPALGVEPAYGAFVILADDITITEGLNIVAQHDYS